MGNTKALDKAALPQLASELDAHQAAGWHKDATLLAGHTASTEQIGQLAAVLAESPHLQRLAGLFADDVPALMAGNWEQVLNESKEQWQAAFKDNPNDQRLLADIRKFRNRSHLAIAFSELLAFINIQQSWALLTQIAEFALQGVVTSLLKGRAVEECGWVIIGLGKLGAGELNYSSDIDLISLYDPHTDKTKDPSASEKQAKHFNTMTRRLSQLLSQQTKDGFGWRVDFRLRPDPAGTPLCLTTDAAVSYYESIARTWERAAFIRARPVAGNLELGRYFLAQISSFIWRRNLDYTVLDDLQIWLRHLPPAPDYLGFDVKLGAFGIRHIELLTHLLQLLGGGRHPKFQQSQTFAALDALEDEGWLNADQVSSMKACYSNWRRLEHRLQYLRDTQTHNMPRNLEDMNRFAAFAGHQNAAALRDELQRLQAETKAACAHPLMDKLLAAHQKIANSKDYKLASSADRKANFYWLAEIGFSRPEDMLDIIDGWMSGRIPATRSEKARHYLTQFLPAFLRRLGDAVDPDAAFACFTDLIRNLPAGAQIFALFVHYPQLADLVGSVLVKAPALTRQLGQKPGLFDLLLNTEFFTPFATDPLSLRSITEYAREAGGPEQALNQLCLWASEERFRVDVHLLQGLCNVREASARLSEIADICIHEITKMARQDMRRRYGQLPEEQFAVIGLGRLGCQQLTSVSDLDLMFVYDSPSNTLSDGQQALEAGRYYNRLSQLIISWLSAQTTKGKLFDVDTRLRPDGKAGSLAIHIQRLSAYFAGEAWPWEYCAFLKARTINVDKTFVTTVQQTLLNIKTSPPVPKSLFEDIRLMRQRLRTNPSAAQALKKRPGGFLDAEFLAILMAVKGGHTALVSDPAGGAQIMLQKLIRKSSQKDMIRKVCSGLHDLELILHFTSLCLGRSSGEMTASENPQTWQALADQLGLATAGDIPLHIENICRHIASALDSFLQSTD
tara:strand:- start:989 stop:3871 length:2883 start_codon:yes stop_codon:yes gene_type:complete